jgi:hypothetical protein
MTPRLMRRKRQASPLVEGAWAALFILLFSLVCVVVLAQMLKV